MLVSGRRSAVGRFTIREKERTKNQQQKRHVDAFCQSLLNEAEWMADKKKKSHVPKWVRNFPWWRSVVWPVASVACCDRHWKSDTFFFCWPVVGFYLFSRSLMSQCWTESLSLSHWGTHGQITRRHDRHRTQTNTGDGISCVSGRKR